MMSVYKTSILFIGTILLCTIDYVQCKRVYQPESQVSISLHKVVASWDEAVEICESEGKHLASPVDPALYKYLKMFIDRNNRPTEYFIGTRLQYVEEPLYVSLEGVQLDDMPNEVINMIERLEPMEGDCLAMSRDHVRAVPCSARLPYLCYRNETTEALTKCVEHYYTYSEKTGSCYKKYRGPSMWREANKTCAEDGAYLVILNDKAESKAVVELFKKDGYFPASWVGLRDNTGTGHWSSIHGDSMDKIYNVWHKYSTNLYVVEACGLVNGDGELFDYFCENYFDFICEKNLEK